MRSSEAGAVGGGACVYGGCGEVVAGWGWSCGGGRGAVVAREVEVGLACGIS